MTDELSKGCLARVLSHFGDQGKRGGLRASYFTVFNDHTPDDFFEVPRPLPVVVVLHPLMTRGGRYYSKILWNSRVVFIEPQLLERVS